MYIDTEEKRKLFESWKSISSHLGYIAPEEFNEVFASSIKMMELMFHVAERSSDDGGALFSFEENLVSSVVEMIAAFGSNEYMSEYARTRYKEYEKKEKKRIKERDVTEEMMGGRREFELAGASDEYQKIEKFKDFMGEYAYPEGISKIFSDLFKGCTGLTGITIPEGVTHIGERSFLGCTGLTSVTIPKSVTYIGDKAFLGCTGLRRITIPKGVKKICDWSFAGCSGLTSVRIPKGVTYIGKQAFSGCTGLKSITMPDSVTEIDEYAFQGCTSLSSVAIPDSVTEIGKYAFACCSSLASIVCPSEFYSFWAFLGCPGEEELKNASMETRKKMAELAREKAKEIDTAGPGQMELPF